MSKNKLKKILGLGAVALGCLTLGVCASQFFKDGFNKIKDKVDEIIPSTTKPVEDNNSEDTVLVDGEEVKTGSVVDMPSKLIFKKNAQVNSNENILTLKASVSPSYAINKNLTWSLSWSDSGSHGTLSDYVTLNVSEDTTTCSVQVNQAFSNQIKLTVSSTDGSNVSKECTIDYLGRNIRNNYTGAPYSGMTSTTDIINDIKDSIYTVYGGSLNSGISVVVDDVYFALVDDPGCDYLSITQCAKDVLIGGYTLIDYFEYVSQQNSGYQDFEVDYMIQCAETEGMGFFVTYHLDYNGSTYYSTSTPYSVGVSATINFNDCLVSDISLSNSTIVF